MRDGIAAGMLATLFVASLCGVASPQAFAEGSADDVVISNPSSGQYEGRWHGERYAKRGSTASRSRTTQETTVVAPKPKPRMTKAQWDAFLAMCLQTYGDSACQQSTGGGDDPDPERAAVSLEAIARTLVVRLKLPDPTPRFGPDPTANEWKMAAVGYPLWLWTDGPTEVTSRVEAYGVSFTLRARWRSTTFDMGDGHQVRCTQTRAYPKTAKPGTASPVCGYAYTKASLPKGNYTVTATSSWRISWSALGQSGTLPGSHTASQSLPVGELNALVVG